MEDASHNLGFDNHDCINKHVYRILVFFDFSEAFGIMNHISTMEWDMLSSNLEAKNQLVS